MTKILIVGSGGHAKACIDLIESEGRFEIVGIVGLPEEVGSKILQYEVVYSDDDLHKLAKQNACIGVGQVGDASTRKRLYHHLKNLGFQMPSIQAPSSYVSKHAYVGEGTLIFQGAVVGVNSRIGCNAIINTKAQVEHDVVVGDHTHISTGVILNGGVKVGDQTFIGSGSVLRQSIKVGNNALIGMGSKVIADVLDGSQYLNRGLL